MNRGITLIEVLVYMALLAILLSSTFSIIFTLGREQDNINLSVERQIYGLAFFESIRGGVEKAHVIYEPSLNSTSKKFNSDTFVFGERIFNEPPKNLIFSRPTSSYMTVEGGFVLRGTTSRAFVFPLNTWSVR